ncbi:MAG: hypothetical protein PHT02_15230 [Tissierellia bacterium]|nr:hypothetical protein [Tissierellia bacterium]
MTIDFTKYEDKYLNLFRAGTTEDPYVIRTDLIKIVNNLAILVEYPNNFYHVTIPGFTEVYINAGEELTEPEPYTFICDYLSRRLIFNSQHNGEMISATYQGMGVILTYACTVALSNSTEEVPITLQDIIDTSAKSITFHTTSPTSSDGNDGDIWFVYQE